jgi:hypothetical protein
MPSMQHNNTPLLLSHIISYWFPIFETSATGFCGTTGIGDFSLANLRWVLIGASMSQALSYPWGCLHMSTNTLNRDII